MNKRKSSTGQEARDKLLGYKEARDYMADHYDLNLNSLVRSRRKKCVEARKMLIYFLRKDLRFTENEVAAALQMNRTTVSYHFHSHEDLVKADQDYHLAYEIHRHHMLELTGKTNVPSV